MRRWLHKVAQDRKGVGPLDVRVLLQNMNRKTPSKELKELGLVCTAHITTLVPSLSLHGMRTKSLLFHFICLFTLFVG